MAMIDEGSKKRKERPRDVPKLPPELEALLSVEDVERVRSRARKAATEEKRKLAEEKLYEQALEEERRVLEPEKEMRELVIDLAPFAKMILLDGRQYFHGMLYRVPRQVYDQLREIVARSWAHDEEVGSPNRKYYEKPPISTANFVSVHPPARNEQISPHNADTALAAQAGRLGVREA